MSELAAKYAPMDPTVEKFWKEHFGPGGWRTFARYTGLSLEEARLDYARMRLTYHADLDQPAGVVHGGAIATLIDTVVVPAIASRHQGVPRMLTVSMTLDYLGPLRAEDAIAEGWVEKRGKRTVFCRAEVRSASGGQVARASLIYNVSDVK
jgi:uncharacterized protein (TIGR00369 family)